MEEKRLKYLQIWRRLVKIYKHQPKNPIGSNLYYFPCCWIVPSSYDYYFSKAWTKITKDMMIQDVIELGKQYNIQFSYYDLASLKCAYEDGMMLGCLDNILKCHVSTIQRGEILSHLSKLRKTRLPF